MAGYRCAASTDNAVGVHRDVGPVLDSPCYPLGCRSSRFVADARGYMARILLTTHGSSGDLNPFLALGYGLRARGHDVRFAVPDRLAVTVTAEGFAVQRLSDEEETALAPYAHQIYGATRSITRRAVPAKDLFAKSVIPTLRTKVEELRAAAAEADLLVAVAHQHAASIVADLTRIPWVTVVLSPLFLPSRSFPPIALPMTPPRPLQRFANQFAWTIGAAMLRRVADRPINVIRAEYGLAPRRNVLLNGNHSHTLTALAVSPAFLPPPPDWPPSVHVTGFCFWDTPAGWEEPEELSAFLDSTVPVVAVCSGSMAPTIRDAFSPFFQTSVAAVLRSGARALVIGAAPGVLPDPLPDDVCAVPFAPFSHIFPRCATVIHHGGIGTVAQALRAGVPMLVVPWGVDQFLSGMQVERIGAGRWMRRSTFTSDRVVPILDALVHQGHYRACVQALADRIAHEDGVRTLCTALEALL